VKVAPSAQARLAVAPSRSTSSRAIYLLTHPEVQGGRLGYRLEEPLHRLENMIINRMVGIRRVPRGDGVDSAPT
jgi:hypothetical protein